MIAITNNERTKVTSFIDPRRSFGTATREQRSMLLTEKKKGAAWGKSHDIRKEKIARKAEENKYANATNNEKSHHEHNWQEAGLRRYRKLLEETGVFDIHGRRVRPQVTVHLQNHSPRITHFIPEVTEQPRQRNRSTGSGSRRNSLVDNIKGSLARDYRKSSAALQIDDRRCYKYVRMLKSGTPRETVEKMMMKALGDEGFTRSLLDNWQDKLIYANNPVQKKNRPRRTSRVEFMKRHSSNSGYGHFQGDDGMSSVDRHEMDMIARHNNTIKLVVTYIIYLMQQQEGRARDLFVRLDTSGDGELSEDEFSAGLGQLGFTLAPDETKLLFKAIDDDESGDIEIKEFVRLLRQNLQSVQISAVEMLSALRRLEVIVSQEHANAVHAYLIDDHGCVAVSELHELIMNPKDLHELDPNPNAELHPFDPAGRPKHKTYRFTNPLLSTALMDGKEMQAAKDRALLHKTVKRLENAYVASAFVIWRAKVIADLHTNLRKKKQTSKLSKGEKNIPVNRRDEAKKKALLAMANDDPDEQEQGGPLAQTTTMTAKIASRRMKKMKEKKKKLAIEKLQNMMNDPQGIPRPEWNTSMMFPYRYKHLDSKKIPHLGKMFKSTAYWKNDCNPKVPTRPSKNSLTQFDGRGKGRSTCTKRMLSKKDWYGTNIRSFTQHASTVSPQFRQHTQQPGIGFPTPEPGGFYIPPSPRTEFPMLEKFFQGGKAKELVRAFQRLEAPIGT